jgi:hypothetical protein
MWTGVLDASTFALRDSDECDSIKVRIKGWLILMMRTKFWEHGD